MRHSPSCASQHRRDQDWAIADKFANVQIEHLEPRTFLSITFPTVQTIGDPSQPAFDALAVDGGTSEQVADLNGDGKADIVALGLTDDDEGPEAVGLFINQGNGLFNKVPILLNLPQPSGDEQFYSLAVADFNGDGVADIAVADGVTGQLYVFLGAGTNVNGATPSFLSPIISQVGSATPAPDGGGLDYLRVAAFSGTNDLIAQAPDLSVVPNTGGGHFGSAVPIMHTTGSPGNQTTQPVGAPDLYAIADLNGDGIPDIVYQITTDTIGVQFGDADGSFSTAVDTYTSTGGIIDDLGIGTLIKDGKPDIVVTSYDFPDVGDPANSPSYMDVFFNDGAGVFGRPVTYNTGNANDGYIVLGDFDGNGASEVAMDISNSQQVGVFTAYVNNGQGDLTQTPIGDPTSSFNGIVTDVIAVDLNGDGKADLVKGNVVSFEGGGGGGGTTTNASPIAASISKSTVPTSVVSGNKVTGNLSLSVSNTGTSTDTGTIAVYASLDGVIDSSSTLLPTPTKKVKLKTDKGAKLSIPLKLPALAAGTYTILIRTTDAAGLVSDSTTGPSLTVAAPYIALSATAGAAKPVTVKPGAATNVTVTLTNSGNIASTGKMSIALGLSIDGETVAIPLPILHKPVTVKPGGKPTILHLSFHIPKGTAAGSYFPLATLTQGTSDLTVIGLSPITIL